MLARLEFEGLRAPLSALWRLVRGGGVYWPSSGSCTLTCQDEGLALEFAFIFMAVLTWWVQLAGARPTLPIDVLGEADVGNASRVLSDHVDVWVQDGGVDGLAVLGQDCSGQGGVR